MARNRTFRRRSTLRRFVTAGAWFFIAVSLLHVTFAIAVMWGQPHGTFKLYHATVDGVSHDALGLTYSGYPGLVFAVLQALTVAAAAALTVGRRPRRPAVRRVAHGLLCGWAALWAGNLVWLASVDGAMDTFAQATLLVVLLLCTIGRAVMGWSPPHAPAEPAAAPADPEFDRTLEAALGPPSPGPPVAAEPPAEPATGVRAPARRWPRRAWDRCLALLKRGAALVASAGWIKRALSGTRRGLAAALARIATALARAAGHVTPQ